ncbi:MAG: glycoside hydrolase family 3 C-terminal domain-containing protein [Clostridiales bacterium]|nr:glycoside hydrolase family 3 C-terminal domain-containing protein [Clostridiales bacterium]
MSMADIKSILSQMTLEEKASMCSGFDFWRLKSVPRLGVPQIMVSDGPHGLRKQDDQADHLGVNDSIKAVCFPAASATAASFDRDLLYKLGAAIGEECQAENVAVVLGPAINIKRSPLCGRNFEYFSEDPYLAGELGAEQVKGTQSKGIGTSVKHFATNNQENHRLSASSEVDCRTLREIYLPAFEKIVKDANPWTVMCSYNKVNGVYASENKELLTDILRSEWGFQGFVVSNWGAVNERVEALKAGLDLEMPYTSSDDLIVDAVKSGDLSEETLDQAVARILDIIFRREAEKELNATYDKEAHHKLAGEIEGECAVLLKNENVLPLSKESKIVFVGEFAKNPRFQGGGSSHINAFKTESALDALAARGIKVEYCQGFSAIADEVDPALEEEALAAVKDADAVVIFAGLPDSFESEGYDRKHLRLPECQNRLIQKLSQANPNAVIVLHNGSPIEMPWVDSVPAILEMYLGGQAVGSAAIDLLFGQKNPSGKLPETFPVKLSDTPSHLFFPGDGKTAFYGEGIFVGYRYYEKKEMPVLFPFGHGLSYSEFEYSSLSLSKGEISSDESVVASIEIKNIGKVSGKEVVQLYVSDKTGKTGSALRPLKELKGFSKLALDPGETKTATFQLDKRSFAFSDGKGGWRTPSGQYEILVGSSSRDIRASATLNLTEAKLPKFIVTPNTLVEELLAHPILKAEVEKLMFSQQKSVETDAASEAISAEMQLAMMMEAPIRSIAMFGDFTRAQLAGLIEHLNGLLEDKQ